MRGLRLLSTDDRRRTLIGLVGNIYIFEAI